MRIQNLLKSGIIAGLVAAAINVILFFISRRLGIINDSILLPNGTPLLLLPVVVSSILPGIVAALVLWGIAKKTDNPVRIFTFVGGLFLLFSLIGPVALPNLPLGFKMVLLLMHLIAGSFIIYFLGRNVIPIKDVTNK